MLNRITKVYTKVNIKIYIFNYLGCATTDTVASLITTLPFNTGLSKNRAKTIRGRGVKKFIGLTDEYKAIKAECTEMIKNSIQGEFIDKQRVYIDVMVFKRDNRLDSHNLIEGLFDAIELAIGVNDRWFVIERYDWKIDKTFPRIELTVVQ